MRWFGLGILLIFLTGVALGQGMPDSCPALVEVALERVGESCTEVGRNQVCYGHSLLNVSAIDGETIAEFESSGDVTDVENIGMLQTAAMDVENGVWGVAVMVLQANIPDTLPGQNVVFVVYGDAELSPDTIEDERFAAPMQAFRLSTGVGQPACDQAPRDGVLVQSPSGTVVNFLVNGVEVEAGSTLLLDVRNEDELWVSTLEGQATVTAEGETQTVLPGEKVLVKPGQPPHGHAPFSNADVQGVPVGLLPEHVNVPFIVNPVDGVNGWIESLFHVDAGSTYTLTASGEVNIYAECDAESLATINLTCDDMIFGPDGSANLGGAPEDYPIPGEVVGALVGRVGLYGEPFVIGSGTTFTAESSGTLFLRLNDAYFPEDNLGAFIVIVAEEE